MPCSPPRKRARSAPSAPQTQVARSSSSSHVDTRSWAARPDHRVAGRARRLSRSGLEAGRANGASAPSTRSSASTGAATRRFLMTASAASSALLEGMKGSLRLGCRCSSAARSSRSPPRLPEGRHHQPRAGRPVRALRRAARDAARDLQRGASPASRRGARGRRRRSASAFSASASRRNGRAPRRR